LLHGKHARVHLVGPVQDFHRAVEVLDERGATLDPVAVVVIDDVAELPFLGGVNVPADDAVELAVASRLRDGLTR